MRHWLLLWMLVLLTACNQGDAGSQPTANSTSKVSKLETNLANLPKSPASFESAKKILYNEIYKGHNITFYCGCDYDPKVKNG
jgi:deoxyribonuclease-1